VNRRRFLNGLITAVLTAASGRLGGVGAPSSAGVDPSALNRLVVLLRETPREHLLGVLVPLIRDGLAYEAEVVQWTCTPQLSKIGLTEEMMR